MPKECSVTVKITDCDLAQYCRVQCLNRDCTSNISGYFQCARKNIVIRGDGECLFFTPRMIDQNKENKKRK